MRKIIRNIKYFIHFNKSYNILSDLLKSTFINDFNILKPKIKVSFRFGYAKYFYSPSPWFGTRLIGIIREEYQNGCRVSSFLTLKEYFEMNKELILFKK